MMTSRLAGPRLKVVSDAEPRVVAGGPVPEAVTPMLDPPRPANAGEGQAGGGEQAGGAAAVSPVVPSLDTLHDTVGDAFFEAWRKAFGELEAQYTQALNDRHHAFEAERTRVEQAYSDALAKARRRHAQERTRMEQDHQAEIEALQHAYHAALSHLEERRHTAVETLKTGLQTELKAYGSGASSVIKRIGEGRLPVRYLARTLNGLLAGAMRKS